MTAPLSRSHLRRTPARAGFTLTELIVVIAIIVLLVGLLLGALGQAQKRAKETSTLATMRAFAAACETFRQEHGFYPGVVPEAILANDPQISGTENALLHLMGGFVREEDVSEEEWDNFGPSGGWKIIQFETPGGGDPYRIKYNVARMGEGPTIAGKPYASYFTPDRDELALEEGQVTFHSIPDLIDAWGQPIIYLRRLRSVGPLTVRNVGHGGGGGGGGAGPKPQFDGGGMDPYLDSTELGRLGRNEKTLSILRTSNAPDATLAKILEHPALPGQPKGDVMLLSAGADGVYFSREDGPGTPGDGAVDNVVDIDGNYLADYSAKVFDEYDDIVVFTGG